ncbi:hypothetical protein L7F22_068980 [Adiantum nelumboides]|nr:hypothetical protein [Adiantum nelumboides]
MEIMAMDFGIRRGIAACMVEIDVAIPDDWQQVLMGQMDMSLHVGWWASFDQYGILRSGAGLLTRDQILVQAFRAQLQLNQQYNFSSIGIWDSAALDCCPPVIYIAEKPNKYKPSITLTQQEVDDAKRLLGSVFMSNQTDLAPTEKYEVPQTASQEYGWCSRPLVEPDPFFNFPHKGCPITKFAAAYEECMHRSPYARRNPVDQHVAKSGVDYVHAGVNTSRIGSPSVTSSAQASSINAKGSRLMKTSSESGLPQVRAPPIQEESIPSVV